MSSVIADIRSGDQGALEKVYLECREPFVAWLMKHYGCSREDGLEFYQSTILIFYDNIISGKLQTLTVNLKTYLFAIGKNKWREYARMKQRVASEVAFSALNLLDDPPDEGEDSTQLQQIKIGLQQLGDPCRSLLEAFYYQGLKLDDIVNHMGYSTKEAARTGKYKCMQRLRKLMI